MKKRDAPQLGKGKMKSRHHLENIYETAPGRNALNE